MKEKLFYKIGFEVTMWADWVQKIVIAKNTITYFRLIIKIQTFDEYAIQHKVI